MTHGALFNGIAGFPLAAQWAGIETTWTVEIDEFCNKVSKKHFPHAIQYTDIHEASRLPYVDIISGGFPCQPYSVSGLQLGSEDARALWPQMLRIIREVKPAYVIGENVTGIIGMALDQVLASLEAEGYTTETFIVPAAGIGAYHKRDRVWIISHSPSKRSVCRCENKTQSNSQDKEKLAINPNGSINSNLLQSTSSHIPEAGLNSGFRNKAWATKPDMDGRTYGIPNRMDRLHALGNAIDPRVAHVFFKKIIELERGLDRNGILL